MKYSVTLRCALVGGLLTLLATPALAERPAPHSTLIEEVRARALKYQPLDAAEIRAAQRRARTAAEGLDRWLGEHDVRVRAAWHELLEWRLLQEQLGSARPDATALRESAKKFYQNIPGLEREQFRELRDRLNELAAVVELASDPAQEDKWHALAGQLEQQLTRYAHEPNGDDAQSIGHALDELQRHGDAGKELVAAVRREYDRPNGYARISGRLLQEFVNIDVNQSEMVTETILGSESRGVVSTRGKVRIELAPDQRHAAIEFRMTGNAHSDRTVSQTGPATVFSRSQTVIDARKRLLADASGIQALPAQAQCSTQIAIDDIDTRSRTVNRLAWRQAEKMQPQAETEAGERASRRVAEQLDKQTAGPLQKGNELYLAHFRNPLLRQGALPEFALSTTNDHLRIAVRERNGAQLGAPTRPPQQSADFDLSLVFHESIVANSSEMMLGGKVCPDKLFLSTIELLTGEAPRPLWVHDRSEPWSARFATSRPISARFTGDEMEISLRFQQLSRGQSTTEVPVMVRATYALDITPDGPRLTRRGEVLISAGCSDAGSVGELPAEFQQLVNEKFAAFFPPTIYFDGLVPPNGGTWGILRKLALRQFSTREGWLMIGYQLAAPQPPAGLATSGAAAERNANN